LKTNWLKNIPGYLKKVYFRNDKRVAAYLVCVFIASAFWFLNALSKTYTIDLIAPVHYTNFPANKTLANKLPEEFELTMRAHGFTLLRQELSFLFSPLKFDVNELTNNKLTEKRKSSFIVPARQFLAELSSSLSNDIEILGMNPDTLFFRFDHSGEKLVKIVPNIQVSLKKQYQISGAISVEPDSVLINGSRSIIDTIQEVKTSKHSFELVSETIEKEVKLVGIKNIHIENQLVKLNIPIEEYTEAEQSVQLTLVNKPENVKIKLFPSKVKVAYQIGLSRFSGIHPEDFRLTVDYDEIQKGVQRLKIKTEDTPPYIYSIVIKPEEIEYLIENE